MHTSTTLHIIKTFKYLTISKKKKKKTRIIQVELKSFKKINPPRAVIGFGLQN